MSTTREGVSLQEAAARAGVSPATLRRWARQGLIPQYAGSWTPPAVRHAQIVARLRERGHSLDDIRAATADGRLAFGYVEELFTHDGATYTLRQAARETGLEPALIKRIVTTLGWSPASLETIHEDEIQLLRYVAA